MARPVSIYDAKTHFSRLVARAQSGEEIIITRGGHPVARLVPLAPPVSRAPGRWRGKLKIAADFDAPLPETVLAEFEGAES
jgi:prevent-host-death family protein